jgi:ribosome-associated toxin RatA of RatAB toxin-antitoxin module
LRKVSRSALVPYSAAEMFALVDDIEAYPSFLPWCGSAVVHKRDGNIVEATLDLQRGGISKSFTTRNTLQQDESIALALIGGPFKQLSGGWSFQQLGDSGSKVSLELEFEFENPVTDVLLGSFFEDTCNSLVDSFTRRATDVYKQS